jgi:hypothetical protein
MPYRHFTLQSLQLSIVLGCGSLSQAQIAWHFGHLCGLSSFLLTQCIKSSSNKAYLQHDNYPILLWRFDSLPLLRSLMP